MSSGRSIFGGIVFGDGDLDFVAVFQGSQLFELFDVFQAAVGQVGEDVEELFGVRIHAEVFVDVEGGFGVSSEGDGGAGEIEGETVFCRIPL